MRDDYVPRPKHPIGLDAAANRRTAFGGRTSSAAAAPAAPPAVTPLAPPSRRTCASCGGRADWHDTHWVCSRCDDEWDSDHHPQYAAPGDLPCLRGDVAAAFRTAAKQWECTTVEGRNAPLHVDGCTGTIFKGDLYVEYLGEAMPYSGGTRYCLPCGLAAWGVPV